MSIPQQTLKDHKEKFDSLYNIYAEYNSHTNISAIREKEDVYEKHFLDSLQILEHQDFKSDAKILDLGSGGGFPVLPLAIALPAVKFYALDATAKKTKFISKVKEELSLDNLEILTGRAEYFAHQELYREQFDFVLARAVAKLDILLELCVGYLKINGTLFSYKACPIEDEIKSSKTAQKKLALELRKKKLISKDKQILFFVKTETLANKYPRQFAQIKSSPL